VSYFSPANREELRAAFRAVRDVAVGKSRDEVRALFLAELRSRDISQPSDDYLEIEVTRVINSSVWMADPRAAARRRPRSRPRLVTRLLFPVRVIRHAKKWRELLPQYQQGHKITFLFPDRSAEPMPVVLEPGAGQWLADGRHLPRRGDPASRIDVWLDFTPAALSDRLVRVHVRKQVVGVLRPEDGDEFRARIEDAQRRGYILMTSGYIAGLDDGSTGFYVYRLAAA
jgi:hypothetical protein